MNANGQYVSYLGAFKSLKGLSPQNLHNALARGPPFPNWVISKQAYEPSESRRSLSPMTTRDPGGDTSALSACWLGTGYLMERSSRRGLRGRERRRVRAVSVLASRLFTGVALDIAALAALSGSSAKGARAARRALPPARHLTRTYHPAQFLFATELSIECFNSSDVSSIPVRLNGSSFEIAAKHVEWFRPRLQIAAFTFERGRIQKDTPFRGRCLHKKCRRNQFGGYDRCITICVRASEAKAAASGLSRTGKKLFIKLRTGNVSAPKRNACTRLHCEQ
ncbi:hypothetical protein EVAR_55232_1 [Eumeta japonica]|uniref:Uncharacterized protein n=1 Tax=Eumeta variegata TaxID=151549 RepID=A0A4C1ZQC9_EUMVA|nr:hypothetical protein EVAR_55232_1 [Eumeta japonica]